MIVQKYLREEILENERQAASGRLDLINPAVAETL